VLNDGLVDMVSNDPAVKELCPVGGFMAELPKDFTLPGWTYRTITEPVDYTLQGGQFPAARIQIDCYGTPAQALNLGRAIDSKLSGFAGTLLDIEATIVQGIFRSDRMVMYDSDPQTFRVMLEYEVRYSK
jgi:hypothetical protein